MIDKQDYVELANLIANSVVEALEKRGLVGKSDDLTKSSNPVGAVEKRVEKTAFQKTEALLFNYMGFKRVVQEKEREIEEIRAYGVPRSCAVHEFVKGGTVQKGIVLEEESVEAAVATVQRSVQGTVQAIALIDKCMAALKNDPYYEVLEMRYFEGRTLEDIGVTLKCTSMTISRNRTRLVKELSLRLFPDQAVSEMMN